MYYIITYGSEVWNRGMEQRYGTDPSSRYGTGVWNGCGPGACSGPPILTCPHIFIFIHNCIYPYTYRRPAHLPYRHGTASAVVLQPKVKRIRFEISRTPS